MSENVFTFKRIGIFARTDASGIRETLASLYQFLTDHGYEIIAEQQTAQLLPPSVQAIERQHLGQHCDLLIAVGGDGLMLQAAHSIVDHGIPVLGINKGFLGFLTDVHPTETTTKLHDILQGHYQVERRFLLTTSFTTDQAKPSRNLALNDIVLYSGKQNQLIEFDIYINDAFVCHQRSDGLITCTPTGSTAYALSAGGPILHPNLSAIALVPMFPHTLTSRPIVIPADSQVRIQMATNLRDQAQLSCDGLPGYTICQGRSDRNQTI